MITFTLPDCNSSEIEEAAKRVGVSYQHFINRLVNYYDANFYDDIEFMVSCFQSADEFERELVEETKPENEVA